MKKAAILLSAIFLFAGLTFAQEPQKPVKNQEPAKTEKKTTEKKDCPKTKECSDVQKAKCCSHSKTAAPKSDPGKK